MKNNIISAGATMHDALQHLNELSGNAMTLFVVDHDGRMIGTLTDGDVRRGLLAGVGLSDTVSRAVNRNFCSISGEICASTVEALRTFRERGIFLIPRLDVDGRIVEIINLHITPNRLPLKALLMAGGKGERLRPMTLTCPKPLLKLEGKAIIDYNIELLSAVGITDITVATKYLAEQLFDHFASPVAGVNVKCVCETDAIGTIGAASLIDWPREGSSIVMNSDIITSISFEEMYLRHIESDADITIGVVPYQVAVPFAILRTEGDRVVALEEKPTYSHYANGGIYIIKNEVLSTVKPNQHTDAPELIEQVIALGGKVTYFPIKGSWIDVGSPADFRQASELMRHHRNFAQQSPL